MDDKDIEHIVVNMSKGDENAFESVVFLYEKRIWSYIYKIVQSREDTTDIVQDTFIKLYTHRKSITSADHLKNWLFMVSTRNTYDFFRKKKRSPQIYSIDDEDYVETIPTDQSYYSTDKGYASYDIERALQNLSPKYRTILLLFYKEDLGYEEIAHILDIPLNTVKTHMHRARNELAKHLKEYESN